MKPELISISLYNRLKNVITKLLMNENVCMLFVFFFVILASERKLHVQLDFVTICPTLANSLFICNFLFISLSIRLVLAIIAFH